MKPLQSSFGVQKFVSKTLHPRYPRTLQTLNRGRPKHDVVLRAMLASPFLIAGLVQFALGGAPLVVGLYMVSAFVALYPIVAFGLDLLTLLPAMYFTLYMGIAVLAKDSLYQPLQSNFLSPDESFLYTSGLLIVVSLVSVVIRSADSGGGWLNLPRNDVGLRRFGWLSAGIGCAATLVNVGTVQRTEGLGNTGAAAITASALISFLYMGIACETSYTINKSNRKAVMSTALVIMLIIGLIASLAVNKRTIFATCAFTLMLTIVIRGAFRARHVIFAAVFALIFNFLISPVVLATRGAVHGQSSGDFISTVVSTSSSAISDPEYLATLKADKLRSDRTYKEFRHYDIFGNDDGVLNRLSFVGLIDEGYTDAKGKERLGFSLTPEILGPLVPRFLFPDKQVARHAVSDSLAYQIGMEASGTNAALNFPLALEGLVEFGTPGFFILPAIGIGCMFLLLSRLSSFRRANPIAIALFCSTREILFEGLSYHYLTILTRFIPIFCVTFLICRFLSNLGTEQRAPGLRTGSPWRSNMANRLRS